MDGLNFVDYGVIIIILLSTIFAFIRGFIGSFLSLVGWVLSIYLAYTAYPILKPLLEAKIKNPIISIVIGHTLLLIGFLIIFGIFNLLASSAVKGLTSGIIDRALGGLFGIVRGIIITSFTFLIISMSFSIFNGENESSSHEDSLPKWITEAKTYGILKQGKDILLEFIPESFNQKFQEMFDEISKKTMDERFLENEIQKLKGKLSPAQINSIEKQVSEESLTQTNDEARYSKLKKMYETYKNNKPSNADSLKKDEVNRIEKLIKDNENLKLDESKEVHIKDEEAATNLIE